MSSTVSELTRIIKNKQKSYFLCTVSHFSLSKQAKGI